MKSQKTRANSRGMLLWRWQIIALIVMVIANIMLVSASLRPPHVDLGGQMLLPMSSFDPTPSPR
jgi:hypothetical protein